MSNLLGPKPGFPYKSIDCAPAKLVALTKSLMDAGVTYELGAKVSPLSLQAGEFKSVDCSGFVRWAIYHASGVLLPDGSANQHDWFASQGFKQSTLDAGTLNDNAVRIAFLTAADGGGTGHVVLITGGKTLESHGGHGPDMRVWDPSHGWMSKCTVWVVNPRPDQ